MDYDFCGWATKNDCLCSDGRVIRRDAFKENNGKKVPLVWNHDHNDPANVLGHALLQNRPEGVYAYGKFNDSPNGKIGKILVQSGDVNSMSICANQIEQNGRDVIHGAIREVSLVIAGANPEAFIEDVITHGDDGNEAIIYFGEKFDVEHADEKKTGEDKSEGSKENIDMASETKSNDKKTDEKTVKDVFETFTEEQKTVVYAIIGQALEDAGVSADSLDDNSDDDSDDKTDKTVKQSYEEGNMKFNVFEKKNDQDATLIHSEVLEATIKDAKRLGSLKESAIEHGIEDIEMLFPDNKNLTNEPGLITRDMDWVSVVMGGVHHTPFSRVKSMFADLTEDEARAKGYIKGKYKKEQVFGLLKRTTNPTTVYKKQKLDRDDVIDITDFDVVSLIRREMRQMLNEELARAYLFGDGRLASSDDKINEQCIRPVWTDDELFTINAAFTVQTSATSDDKAKAFIRAAIKARKNYKGSGNPVLFTTEDVLTDMLLLTDSTGRDLYTDEAQLARKLRVSRIVTVPVMEGLTRTVGSKKRELFGLILNLRDYNVGADRGGQVSMFDDFDIDYNAQKYLIETRCSGALTVPYSAIAVELESDPI